MPKISIVTPFAAVHYVRSQEGPANAELAFFEILISEIAANTGGQAAMVEDRLGHLSQLGFNTILLSSGEKKPTVEYRGEALLRQRTYCCFNRGASSNGRGPAGTPVPAGLQHLSENIDTTTFFLYEVCCFNRGKQQGKGPAESALGRASAQKKK